MMRVVVLADRVVHVDLWSAQLVRAGDVEVVFGGTDIADVVRCSDDTVDAVVVDVAASADALADIADAVRRRWPSATLVVADADVDLATMLERMANADVALTMLSPSSLRSARGAMRSTVKASPSEAYVRLTEREREVLELLSRGNAPSAIAADLRISVNTCRGYLRTLMAKLGVRSQLEVMAYVAEHGLPVEGS